jgi:hypothetical protein
MINDFIKFYNENLTFYAIFGLLLILCASIPLFTLVSKVSINNSNAHKITSICDYLITLSPYIFSLFLLFFIVKIGTYFNAMTIKKHYPEMYISKYKWSQEKIELMIHERLNNYLKEHDFVEKIDDINKLIIQRAKNEVLPYFAYSTVFIALFICLWNSYIDKILDYFKSDILLMTTIALAITFGIIVITFFIIVIHFFRDSLLTNYEKLNKLSSLLEEHKIRKQ